MGIRAVGVAMGLLLTGAASPAWADYVSTLTSGPITAPASLNFGNSTTAGTLNTQAFPPGSGPTIARAPYNFLDAWNFVLANNADVSSFVGTLNFTTTNGTIGINNLELGLFGPGGQVGSWQSAVILPTMLPGIVQWVAVSGPNSLFAGGGYSLQVRGTLIGSASSYAGTLSALSPSGTTGSEVPIPPTLPLLAAGLLVFATLARRRGLEG